MKRLVASVVSFSFVTALAVGAQDKKAPDIGGTWIAVGGSAGTKKIPEDFFTEAMLSAVFKEGKYKVIAQGKNVEEGTYKIDGDKKPSTIDMFISECKDKGKTQLGILKLEADTLTIALTDAGNKDRPKGFDAAEGVEVTVLKRKK